MKSGAERSVEALTWAAVVMWLGFALIMHLLGYTWLILMVLSIILLSSAIYQRSRGWHTSLMIWVSGVWMAVFSMIEIVNEMVIALNNGAGLQIDLWVYLGIALVSMGVAVVLRHMQGPSLPATRTRSQASGQRPQAPRQVSEDLSVGYTPPVQQQRTSRRQASRPAPAAPERRQAPPTPAKEPDDLESRVEDIIRRSRERRDRDNLPY